MTIEQFDAFDFGLDSRPRIALPQESDVDETERAGLQRASNGDSVALSQLYDRYASALHRVLTAILQNPEDAEDALQETFLKLLGGKMWRAQNARAYFFGSARHIALDMLRRRKREQNRVIEFDETTQNPNDDWSQCLLMLPLEQREVVALKVFEAMTFAEIAVVVKARPNTVASRYRYGIEKLRQILLEEDGDV